MIMIKMIVVIFFFFFLGGGGGEFVKYDIIGERKPEGSIKLQDRTPKVKTG